MGRISVEATGGYDWPPLPSPTVWERLGGWRPRRRARQHRRACERRDWQMALHAAACLEASPRVTRGRLVLDQGAQRLQYEVFLGVLAVRGAVPLGEARDWDAAIWAGWSAGLVGPGRGQVSPESV